MCDFLMLMSSFGRLLLLLIMFLWEPLFDNLVSRNIIQTKYTFYVVLRYTSARSPPKVVSLFNNQFTSSEKRNASKSSKTTTFSVVYQYASHLLCEGIVLYLPNILFV